MNINTALADYPCMTVEATHDRVENFIIKLHPAVPVPAFTGQEYIQGHVSEIHVSVMEYSDKDPGSPDYGQRVTYADVKAYGLGAKSDGSVDKRSRRGLIAPVAREFLKPLVMAGLELAHAPPAAVATVERDY